MPKISKAQGPSYPPPAVELYPEPSAEDGSPDRDGMADAPGELGDGEPIPTPTSGIVGTVDGSGNVTPHEGADTEEHDTLEDDDDEGSADAEQDSEQDEGVALPPQNAVKDEWISALRELGVSDDWLAEDENGKGRTKDDLILVGQAIRDGELVVDDDGVPQSTDG